MKLEHLVYTSTPTTPFTPAQVAEIARRSAEKNGALLVTGLLLYGGGQLMQLLEGPTQSLDHLIRKIGADPRHRDLKICHRGEVAGRLLSGWNMGLLNLVDASPLEPALLTAALATATPSPRLPAGTHHGLALLQAFRSRYGKPDALSA